jgi:DNA-binding XRE family transcriptional regulator
MSVPREDFAPVWTRSFPIPKQPKTIGEQLRWQRISLGIRQTETVQRLRVSQLTMSLWERDKVYPTWAFQPRLAEYPGFDPFTNPALGSPKGNEPPCVANLAPEGPLTLAQRIAKRRLESRKTRQECANQMGGERQNSAGMGSRPKKAESRLLEPGVDVPRN